MQTYRLHLYNAANSSTPSKTIVSHHLHKLVKNDNKLYVIVPSTVENCEAQYEEVSIVEMN